MSENRISKIVSPSVNGIEYWAENVEYLSGKLVSVGNSLLKCILTHTSSPSIIADVQAKKWATLTPFPMTQAERLSIIEPLDGTTILQTNNMTGIYTYGDGKWNSPFVMADSLYATNTSTQVLSSVGDVILLKQNGNLSFSQNSVTLLAGKEYKITATISYSTDDTAGNGILSVVNNSNTIIEKGTTKIAGLKYTGTTNWGGGDVIMIHYTPDVDTNIKLKVTEWANGSLSIINAMLCVNEVGASYYNSIGSENNPVESVHTIKSISKGDTNDGSTKLFSGFDSDNVEVFSVDTDGNIKTGTVFHINNGTNNIFENDGSSTRIYSGDGTKYIGTYNNYNYSRGNFVSASDSNYNLGDSSHVWGSLYMNGDIMTNSAFAIHDGTRNRFYFDSTLSGLYSPNGSNYLYANDSYTISNGHFVPKTTATFSLGVGTYRWAHIYMSGNIYTSGSMGMYDGTRLRISYGSSDAAMYSPDGNNYISVNNTYITPKSTIRPYSHASYSLGASDRMWLDAYFRNDFVPPLKTYYNSASTSLGGVDVVSLSFSSSQYSSVSHNIYRSMGNNNYMISHMHYYQGRICVSNNGAGDATGAYLNRGATSWSSSSDRRIKENIKDISYGLDTIKSLNPISFNYINYTEDESITTDTKFGLIAQDAYEIIPEIVNVGSDEEVATNEDIAKIKNPWSIEYTLLIPVLIKAVQELSQKINDLESTISN